MERNMLKVGVGAVVALILATTAAVAAEMTVEHVKAKYAAIFDAPPQKIDGRTYFVHRCSVKAVDLIVGGKGSGRATSSVLIGLSRLSEKEEMPWPDDSVSESAAS